MKHGRLREMRHITTVRIQWPNEKKLMQWRPALGRTEARYTGGLKLVSGCPTSVPRRYVFLFIYLIRVFICHPLHILNLNEEIRQSTNAGI